MGRFMTILPGLRSLAFKYVALQLRLWPGSFGSQTNLTYPEIIKYEGSYGMHSGAHKLMTLVMPCGR